MLTHIDYHYRGASGIGSCVRREFVPASYERSNDVRLVGFGVRELLALRRLLDEKDTTLATVLDVARAAFEKADAERAWREHFGVLAEIEEPEDDTPFLKCLKCDFKVVLPYHAADGSMRCDGDGHEIWIGRTRWEPSR